MPNIVDKAVERLEKFQSGLKSMNPGIKVVVEDPDMAAQVASDLDLVLAEVSRLRSRGGDYE